MLSDKVIVTSAGWSLDGSWAVGHNDLVSRAAECAKRIPQGGTFLEIGVWRGANMSNVLRLRPDVSGICVDPYAAATGSYATSGSSDSRLNQEGFDQVYRIAQRNLEPYKGRVSFVRKRARDFVSLAIREKYDVIFIDGDHSYEGCAEDIADWTSRAGAWIGGHDYGKVSFPGVTRAVQEAFGAEGYVLGGDSTWWRQSL